MGLFDNGEPPSSIQFHLFNIIMFSLVECNITYVKLPLFLRYAPFSVTAIPWMEEILHHLADDLSHYSPITYIPFHSFQ